MGKKMGSDRMGLDCSTISEEDVPCNMPGIWLPKLVFYPPKEFRPQQIWEMVLDIPICRLCKDQAEVGDFAIDDEQWDDLVRIYAESGFPIPDRSRTRLEWVRRQF